MCIVMCYLHIFRSQTLQGAQRQVQQANYPQCHLSLLPGWQSQRAPEEPDPRGQFSYNPAVLNVSVLLTTVPYSCCTSFFHRSWRSASPTTWWSCFVTEAVSSGHSTRTSPTLRRYRSWQAPDPRASAKRWSTSCTSTVQTESSSPSFLPRLCQSAWMPWPSTTTCGRPREVQCQRKVENSRQMYHLLSSKSSYPHLACFLNRLHWCSQPSSSPCSVWKPTQEGPHPWTCDRLWVDPDQNNGKGYVCVCVCVSQVVWGTGACNKKRNASWISIFSLWSQCDVFRFLLVRLLFFYDDHDSSMWHFLGLSHMWWMFIFTSSIF